MSRTFAAVVYALTLVFFGAFFLQPIIQTLAGAFIDADGKVTFAFVAEVFRNEIYTDGLRNAFLLALASTAATLAIALPLAFVADRVEFPGKKLLSALLLVPMILPPFVGAIGIRQILGQYGSLNSALHALGLLDAGSTIDWLGRGRFWGMVALNALHLYPILYLNVSAALANVDPAMEEAAENLGCTGFRKFRKITVPLIMPGLFAGGDMVPAERNVTVAIGHGKKAARHIDAWLRGVELAPAAKHAPATFERLNPWYYSDAPKTVRPQLDLARRTSSFDEVQGGLTEDNALFEARRCLSCGNCFECDNCYGVCPDNAVVKLGPGNRFAFNYDYCKGCGVCVAECPCGAIEMIPEDV